MNQHHTHQSIQQQSNQTNDQTNDTEIPNSIRLIRSDTLNNTNPEKKIIYYIMKQMKLRTNKQ